MEALVLNNQYFKRTDRPEKHFDTDFFTGANVYKVSQYKFRDFFVNETFKSLDDLKELGLSNAQFFLLRAGLILVKNKKGARMADEKSQSMEQFFRSYKKGSKKTRNILTHHTNTDISELVITQTFFRNIELEIPLGLGKSKHLGFWSLSFLKNDFREFTFKFYGNTLPLNTRTSHFGGSTRHCTFCFLEDGQEIDESFAHFFLECKIVKKIHSQIEKNLLAPTLNEETGERVARWMGLPTVYSNSLFSQLVHLHIQFYLYKSKLQNRLPNVDFIIGETIYDMDVACQKNFNIYFQKNSYNANISRLWGKLARPRW
jgi:hypothetical protein